MKETKEAVIGILVIGKLVAEVLKDGPQITDAITLFAKLQEPEYKAKIDAAIADVNMVKAEIDNAKFTDYLDLFAGILPELKSILEQVQK
jgi:hypothetical protein